MTTPIDAESHIKIQRRVALSRYPRAIGIDYIEVERNPNVDGEWRLLVYFVRDTSEDTSPEATQSLILSQITPIYIRITWQQGDPTTNLIVLDVRPEGDDDLIVVRVRLRDGESDIQDFPTYTLELVDFPNVDRFFSSAQFTLNVEQHSDVNAQESSIERMEVGPTPPIDYLAKDYASFRHLMMDHLSQLVPGWTETSPADLGVSLVELMAYAGDYLSYYQDAVATEAYLGTARQRISVGRHARLLGYRMHQGCNSRVWVHVKVNSDLLLQEKTALLTTISEYAPRIPRRDYPFALQKRPQVFETMHSAQLYTSHNEINFYTWGAQEFYLHRSATQATLDGDFTDQKKDKLKKGDVLVFEEVLGHLTGLELDKDVRKRHAVRLTADAVKTTDILHDDHIVTEIQWSTEDALPFDMHISAQYGNESITNITVARGNMVLADQGRTISDEDLPLVPYNVRYRPRLQEPDLTFMTAYDHRQALSNSAASVYLQRPHEAMPVIRLDEHDSHEWLRQSHDFQEIQDQWTAQRDLLSSSRFAKEFKVEMRTDLSAYLEFGDGILGRQPEPGTLFTAQYRVGNGAKGNIGRDSISHIVSDDDGIEEARNPLPAFGAVDPEPIEEVRMYSPETLRIQERCVTVEDYAERAWRYPDVVEAKALIRWTGSWQTVFIYVDRYGGKPVDREFRRGFLDYMDRYRMTGSDLKVASPRFVGVDIGLTIYVEDNYFRSTVRRILNEYLGSNIMPDGEPGFFHPDNFTFGQEVYLSDVVTRATEAPGVTRVDVSTFRRWDRTSGGQQVNDEIDIGPFEVARMDNNPNEPWNGTVRFTMRGGW